MLKNKVDSIRKEILLDCFQRITCVAEGSLATNDDIHWANETLGEETSAVSSEVRTVYFSLKHIVL